MLELAGSRGRLCWSHGAREVMVENLVCIPEKNMSCEVDFDLWSFVGGGFYL